MSSKEQFSALFAKIKEDVNFREKLQAAKDLDAAASLVKDAGFDVSTEDWFQFVKEQELVDEPINDEEIEAIAGGIFKNRFLTGTVATGEMCGTATRARNCSV